MKREELLGYLKLWKMYIGTSEEDEKQAYKEIVALIKGGVREVTEEWIEEKAVEIYNLSYHKSFHPKEIADCLRSLIKECLRSMGKEIT